jgi:2-polyprenyl-6-hydroxyphenyl methylase/3-demethylubiquinone-9 3-methyltransferase
MLDKSKLTSTQKKNIDDDTNNDASAANFSPEEIAKFDALAENWWDPNGKYKTAIEFNRERVSYFIDQICAYYKLDATADKPLAGLKIIDVGCGGGLVCEPLAQAGATVVGIDVSEMSIEVAKRHAIKSGLTIDYRHQHAKQMSELEPAEYDIVINAEVIEHVPNQKDLVKHCATLCKEGGCVIMATLNRTIKSFIVGIIGAEYIMRYLPIGTHSWYLFVTPFELNSMASVARMSLVNESGMAFNLFKKTWRTTSDVGVNYIQVYKKLGPIK